jgi:uncharacterized protein
LSKDYAAWGLAATITGIELRVRVQPRASRNAVIGPHDGMTRIALTAPPVEGAANAALLAYLADLFAVSKRSITLVRGQTARAKLVRVEGIGIDQAHNVLEAAASSLRKAEPANGLFNGQTDKRTNRNVEQQSPSPLAGEVW